MPHIADDRLSALIDCDVLHSDGLMPRLRYSLERLHPCCKVRASLLKARSALSCCAIFSTLASRRASAIVAMGCVDLTRLKKSRREWRSGIT